MDIHFVSEEDRESIKHILAYCFDLTDETLQPENCLGAFDKDALAALLYINPLDMYFQGKTVGMGGIGVVSTLPEYRHSHCASGLLIKSLEVMRDRGYLFSALGPFSYSFYRRYGWNLAFHRKRYRISMENLKAFEKRKSTFRPLALKDADNVRKLYEAFMARYNGPIRRNAENWESRFKKLNTNGNYVYGCSHDGKGLDGYIFYSLKGMEFHIHEMVYDSLETRLDLLCFVYAHKAQADDVIWLAPPDDNTPLLLENPNIEQSIKAGMMIRVVDVKRVLEAYSFPPEYHGSFTVKVEDLYAPWNSVPFRVVIENGNAAVEGIEDGPIDVKCDIQTFSQIMFGYLGMGEAMELGKIDTCSPELSEDIKNLFVGHPTCETDSF
jgi:predicted acetyltransferase